MQSKKMILNVPKLGDTKQTNWVLNIQKQASLALVVYVKFVILYIKPVVEHIEWPYPAVLNILW